MITATRPSATICSRAAASSGPGEWTTSEPSRNRTIVMRASKRAPASETGYGISHMDPGTYS